LQFVASTNYVSQGKNSFSFKPVLHNKCAAGIMRLAKCKTMLFVLLLVSGRFALFD